MQQTQNILPVARTFERNESFDWQINAITGISCDYANQLGLTELFCVQARIEGCAEMGVPIKSEQIKQSLLSYLERMRSLPSYSEFMREKVEASNSVRDKQYDVSDFICDVNRHKVVELEELAGQIREAAQPSDDYEGNLTHILELVRKAKKVVYDKPENLTPEEIEYFVRMFCELDIQVK